MVSPVSKAGLRDWIAQRVTALILGVYAFFVFAYLFFCPHVNYVVVHKLYSHLVMKMATIVVVVSILWHAWIGLWTIFTDYVKPKMVRLALEVAVMILLLAYVVWVIEIFWHSI